MNSCPFIPLPTKIIGVGVHGKFIYWITRNDIFLYNTLGMTGEWSIDRKKHSRVEIVLEDTSVFFNDQRNFGTLKYCSDPKLLVSKLQSLGPDLLANDVPNDKFVSQLRKNNDWNITKALMDQSVVAGVGNYVKAEALWLARISPHRKVSDISDSNMQVLNRAIQTVMKESFVSGGATVKSYKDFFGEMGNYSSKFMVYNQKSDPDGYEVIKEKTPDGRTTHWVPEVQR